MIQVVIWIALWAIVVYSIANYEGEEKMKSKTKKTKWVEGRDLKKTIDNKSLADKLISDIYYCPFCGEEAYWDTDYGQQLFDYCPYCGEPMMEETEDVNSR